MKIMMLTPCLMLPNNREYNSKCIQFNMQHLKFDEYVIYDQAFEETDYIEGCTYIGHVKERAGWVKSRNALLEYFYNSDCDYAFWVDANSIPSKPTLNDLTTIIDELKSGNLRFCDAIFSTLGMWVSQERIQCKASPDFFDKVRLMPTRNDRSYNWMHGLFHINYKKYYGQEFYIDTRCDVRLGTAEDVYFTRLIRNFSNCWVAPTVVMNKPSSKMSCDWSNSKGTYDYPPVQFDLVDSYIAENAKNYNYTRCGKGICRSTIVLQRNNYMKDLIKPYQPRGKKAEQSKQKKLF